MTKEFSKEDWLVTIIVFVLVISSDVLAGRLGYGQKLSDECALTIGVLGLIIGFWRGGWHRSKFWILLTVFFALHGVIFWLVFSVIAPGVIRIPTFSAIAIGIAEIILMGKLLLAFKINLGQQLNYFSFASAALRSFSAMQ